MSDNTITNEQMQEKRRRIAERKEKAKRSDRVFLVQVATLSAIVLIGIIWYGNHQMERAERNAEKEVEQITEEIDKKIQQDAAHQRFRDNLESERVMKEFNERNPYVR